MITFCLVDENGMRVISNGLELTLPKGKLKIKVNKMRFGRKEAKPTNPFLISQVNVTHFINESSLANPKQFSPFAFLSHLYASLRDDARTPAINAERCIGCLHPLAPTIGSCWLFLFSAWSDHYLPRALQRTRGKFTCFLISRVDRLIVCSRLSTFRKWRNPIPPSYPTRQYHLTRVDDNKTTKRDSIRPYKMPYRCSPHPLYSSSSIHYH